MNIKFQPSKIFIFTAIFGIITFRSFQVLADQMKPISPVLENACAVLEAFEGDVQILNESRKQLIEVKGKSNLPCGCWISANQGWVEIRHSSGAKINLGSETFVQLSKPDKSDAGLEDHLILFRGQIYVDVEGGSEPFRIVSASSRVKTEHGKLIFISGYSKDSLAQLTVLENSALFENRFESTRSVKVNEGEASEINFELLRVIPQIPSAVSVASLRPKLLDLHIPEKTQNYAIRVASDRQSRKFASLLNESDLSEPKADGAKKPAIGRKLASISKKVEISQYLRAPVSSVDSVLSKHWVNRMVAGEEGGEKILFPGVPHKRTLQNHLSLDESEDKLDPKFKKRELIEKKRLLDEIARLQTD